MTWDDRRRVAPLETDEDPRGRAPPGVTHVPCQGHRRVGLGVDPQPHRRAGLLSPAVDVDALTLSREDTARVPMAWRCRDATPCTGGWDSQARAQAHLDWHCPARVTAVTRATLDARQPHGDARSSGALARLKRRAFPHQLSDRMWDP